MLHAPVPDETGVESVSVGAPDVLEPLKSSTVTVPASPLATPPVPLIAGAGLLVVVPSLGELMLSAGRLVLTDQVWLAAGPTLPA